MYKLTNYHWEEKNLIVEVENQHENKTRIFRVNKNTEGKVDIYSTLEGQTFKVNIKSPIGSFVNWSIRNIM